MRRRGFTLFELLIALAAAALVVGLLLPALSPLRVQARRITCTGNLSAIGTALDKYVSDARGVYPGSFALPERSPPFWMTLLGGPGIRLRSGFPGASGDYTAGRSERPLNRYLDQPELTARCPLDRGDSYAALQGPAAAIYGCSYAYPDRGQSEIEARQWVIAYGVWAVEGHRQEEVRRPERKVLVADLGLRADRPIYDPRNNWHGTAPLPPELAANAGWARAANPGKPGDPPRELKVNLLFGDGHVAEEFRKEDFRSRYIHREVSEAEVRKLEESRYY